MTLIADQIVIDGQGNNNTVVSSRAAGGEPSSVNIIVNNALQVLNRGQIDTTQINADGDGGDISLSGGQWFQLHNAKITTSVRFPEATSRAGDIDITIPVLILDSGEIIAGAESKQAIKGDVTNIPTQIVASRGGFNTTRNNRNSSFINVINAAPSGELKITSPVLNIVGTLVDVVTLNLEIERLSQDPCAHRHENSLNKLGHGGAPAFQHGENYLPINRFDEFERELGVRDVLQTTSPINANLQNTATECANYQRTSLN